MTKQEVFYSKPEVLSLLDVRETCHFRLKEMRELGEYEEAKNPENDYVRTLNETAVMLEEIWNNL